MKKKLYGFVLMLLAVIVACGMICVDTGAANAKSKWQIGLPEIMWTGDDMTYVSVWSRDTEAVVTYVKSSNPKAAKVRTEKWKNEKGKKQKYFFLEPKAAGKTDVTVQFKTPGGKKLTQTMTVKVKKYPNHIKSLKVNGKTVNISKNKFRYSKGKIKTDKVNVDLKLKNGWKITSAWGNCWNMNGDDSLEIRNAKPNLKKGKAIKFPKKYSEFELMIEMKKGNTYITYHVRLSRTANP